HRGRTGAASAARPADAPADTGGYGGGLVMTMAPTPRAVLIYRDRLLSFSETFILNQARALQRFGPVFVGRQRVPGLALDGQRVEVAGQGGPLGGAGGIAQFLGRPTSRFVSRLGGL